jgi:hypothetical protein
MSGVAAEKVDDQSERQNTTTEEYIGRIPV